MPQVIRAFHERRGELLGGEGRGRADALLVEPLGNLSLDRAGDAKRGIRLAVPVSP